MQYLSPAIVPRVEVVTMTAPLDRLFGITRAPDTPAATHLDHRAKHEARTIGRMRALYGRGPDGARCGSCASLFRTGEYFKCRRFKVTRGEATDWRVRWAACGAWSPREASRVSS